MIIVSLDNEAAGTTYYVRRMAETLSSLGVHISIHSLGNPVRISGVSHVAHPGSLPGPREGGKLALSFKLKSALRRFAGSSSVVHSHGLWRMPCIYSADAAKSSARPHIISIHGMLSPEALGVSKLSKEVFWRIWQHRALSNASCLHATSEREFEDIRRLGLLNPVAIVPGGIDILPKGMKPLQGDGSNKLLYLGRVHPLKQLDRLIEAWSQLELEHPDWTLSIVGPGKHDYVERLKKFAKSLGCARIEFLGPQYAETKWTTYSEADLFILPSASENFGFVVAEALAAGTPVICTNRAPWTGLEDFLCGWQTDTDVASLRAVLSLALKTPRIELNAMGQRGQDWMARDYSWQQGMLQMIEVYRWLIEDRDPPGCVRVD